MTAKEFLRQYQDNLVEIRNIDKEIERLEAHAMSVSQPTDKERVQSSATQDSADTIAKIADMQVEVEALRDEALNKLKEVTEIIRSIEPSQYGEILYLRYIEGKTFEKIAERINRSYQWTCELHGRALKEVEKKIKKVSPLDSN